MLKLQIISLSKYVVVRASKCPTFTHGEYRSIEKYLLYRQPSVVHGEEYILRINSYRESPVVG